MKKNEVIRRFTQFRLDRRRNPQHGRAGIEIIYLGWPVNSEKCSIVCIESDWWLNLSDWSVDGWVLGQKVTRRTEHFHMFSFWCLAFTFCSIWYSRKTGGISTSIYHWAKRSKRKIIDVIEQIRAEKAIGYQKPNARQQHYLAVSLGSLSSGRHIRWIYQMHLTILSNDLSLLNFSPTASMR